MSAPESKTDWSYRGLCPHLHPHPHQSHRAACHKHRHPALASGTVAGSSSLTAGIQLMCMQYGCKLHYQCPQYTNTITFSLSTSLWRERKLSCGCFVREREVMESGWKPNVEISPNCPRCGSCNTKFCYYNNYSLTQPRYFCKSCRRYWTKGGSLRNVPVGGGCRKSRRCKSIRISGTGPKVGPTTDFGYNGNILGESSSSSSSSMMADGSIDLARVYADFLNQESVPETRFEMPKLLRDVDLSFHYASTNMNTNFNFQFPLEMDLISKGGEMYQETIEEFGSDRKVSNCGLPPLPGEEVVVAPEMEWPSSDMMVPNHFVHMSQLDRIESEDLHSKQFIGNKSSLFDMSSYETLFRP